MPNQKMNSHAVILTLPRPDTAISGPDLEVIYQTGYNNNYLLDKIENSHDEYPPHEIIVNLLKKRNFESIKLYSFYQTFLYLIHDKYLNLLKTDISSFCILSRYFSSESINYEIMSLIFNMKRLVENIIQYDCYLKNNNTCIDSIGKLMFSKNSSTIHFQEKHSKHQLFLQLLNRLNNAHKHSLFETYNLPTIRTEFRSSVCYGRFKIQRS